MREWWWNSNRHFHFITTVFWTLTKEKASKIEWKGFWKLYTTSKGKWAKSKWEMFESTNKCIQNGERNSIKKMDWVKINSLEMGGHRSANAISGLEQCAGGFKVTGADLHSLKTASSTFSHLSAQDQSQSGVTKWTPLIFRAWFTLAVPTRAATKWVVSLVSFSVTLAPKKIKTYLGPFQIFNLCISFTISKLLFNCQHLWRFHC